jgi:hypothetical protein
MSADKQKADAFIKDVVDAYWRDVEVIHRPGNDQLHQIAETHNARLSEIEAVINAVEEKIGTLIEEQGLTVERGIVRETNGKNAHGDRVEKILADAREFVKTQPFYEHGFDGEPLAQPIAASAAPAIPQVTEGADGKLVLGAEPPLEQVTSFTELFRPAGPVAPGERGDGSHSQTGRS